ncbi:MAG: phosphoenolpyruvate synthase [Fluviicola sp.]|nr:phosphoenolpyruvate synthase [Fluviicola sp.]
MLRQHPDPSIGGKAKNLSELSNLGLNVPHWVVLSQQLLKDFSDDTGKLTLPADLLDEIQTHFSDADFLAVRSSALDEDGGDFSFAGLFETKLFVRKENLAEQIQEVWKSSFAERVQLYREKNGLKQSNGLGIIIQVMISSESSGVAFGINPVTGNRKQQLISAVFGLGEGLVSGELDADNYLVTENGIETDIAIKTHSFHYNKTGKSGIVKEELPEKKKKAKVLYKEQIKQVQKLVKQLGRHFGKPQDIEFAFADRKLYLLQSRPITSLSKIPDKNDTYVLWDNSNIIESYPGVTTPLTFSFISKSYEGAYRLFCEYLGVDKKVIERNTSVFENTLGLINGRVYYNLKTWYLMLAMLPGYSINARFMEKMMGVKERFDIPESYLISKGQAWWRIVKMGFKMTSRYYSLSRKRKDFENLLNATIAKYKAIDFTEKSANELLQLYLDFEHTLLNEWKAPLLNDFFAMIWFGRLQSMCEKKLKSVNPNIHNDLLCGSADIISTQPIHRTIALSTEISQLPEMKEMFLNLPSKQLWNKLKNAGSEDESGRIYNEIQRYITDFGERCVGELKLETISYTQDPTLFLDILKSYVQNEITLSKRSGNKEAEIRSKAEAEVNSILRGKFYKKYKFNKALRKTRELVSSRENLRYERTRAFGIVRELFSAMGIRFYAEGILNKDRDIFYLTKEEITQFIQGRSVTQDLKKLVELRKSEFEVYEGTETPAERFASYGLVYHANDFFSTDKVEQLEGDLKGTGCCPGRVTARVQVVKNPKDIASLHGAILVTSSTDPGWVTLFPSASAIIVERGSLLSHSAIVSREMGIPCIVGVTGLLRTLKTGDLVEMDGSTGTIKIIEKKGTPENE